MLPMHLEQQRPARSRCPAILGRVAGVVVGVPLITLGAIVAAEPAGAAPLGPEVRIEADEGVTFRESYDVADGLEPETVLRMHVSGFEPFAQGVAEQCASAVSRLCGNRIPVQFGADGVARFQYFVTDGFLDPQPMPGRCRATGAACTVVVRATKSNTRGEIQTVFVDSIRPPGRIEVSPSSGLSLKGETVTVRVQDYPPGAAVNAMVCAAPDAAGLRCGAPGPTASLVVGRDGRGSTKLVVEPGVVGQERIRCFRGDDCGISVASDAVFVRAPVVPISFAAPPGAAYDPTRLAFGLGIAALLVAIATWLMLHTDWSAVGEAAAPEIDDAEYADLDGIIAALPPEDEELVPSR